MKRLAIFLILAVLPAGARAAWKVYGISLAHSLRGGGYGSNSCRAQIHRMAYIGGTWIAVSDFARMNAVDDPHRATAFPMNPPGYRMRYAMPTPPA